MVAVLCLLFLFLTACSQDIAETQIPPVVSETAVSVPTNTPPPTPDVTPPDDSRPDATPTPFVPDIAITDQVLTDEGRLTIASVTTTQAGWVVIYAMLDGELGEVLGYTAVAPGLNTDLPVSINSLEATPDMAVILHVDEGLAGEFEYPDGPDVPLEFETGQIAETFSPEFQLSLPTVNLVNQEIKEDGLIYVENITALKPGWLVIHADEGGELGDYLGSVPLVPGLNEGLVVHIPWQQGTTTLYAVLYDDNGRAQQLDIPGADTPVIVNGEPFITPFTVTYPPDLFVLDQPVIDGKFEVERVYSNGPGWLVVYYDDGGKPGLIIGYTALADGVNENITAEVLGTAVTNPLHIRLHEDSEPGDAFDFPRVDPPITYQDRQLGHFSFNTEPGSYVITSDQIPEMLTTGGVQLTVPYAIVEQPAWVAIHADVNGVLGEILGVARLKAGLNRDVVVEIEGELPTGTVHAALYADDGALGEFEYPNGADRAIQRNRRTLSAPFILLTADGEPAIPTDQ